MAGLFFAWWFSPSILEKVLSRQLQAYNISLLALVMPRPTSASIYLNEIELMTESWRLVVSGITVTPSGTSLPAQVVTIDSASIQFADSGDNEAPVWEDAITAMQETIGFVPSSGSIQFVDICRKDCLRGQLHWQRSGGVLRADFHSEDRGATFNIELSQNLPGVMMNLYSSDTPFYLATLAATVGDTNDLKVEGSMSFNTTRLEQRAKPLPIMPGSLEGFDAEITTLKVSFTGKAPLDSKVDLESVTSDLAGHADLSADLAWNLTLAESNLNGSQHQKIGIDILHGSLKIVLEDPMQISIDNPVLDKGNISISAGSQCLLDLNTIGQTGLSARCTSTDISVATNLDGYALSANLDDARLSFKNFDWSLTTPANVIISEDLKQMMTGKMNLSADNQQITLHSNELSILGMNPFSLEIHHDLTNSTGRGTLDADLSANQLTGLAEYLNIEKLDIKNGAITINSAFGWDIPDSIDGQSKGPITHFSTQLAATELGLTIDGYDLEGGYISADFAGWPVIASSRPISMTWRLLNIGVPIGDIDMAFNLEANPDKQTLYLSGNSLAATAFGGMLNSSEYDYEIIAGNGDLNLLLDELDLHEILKLQEEELHSTGKFSGSVPVQVRQGKLSVSLGNIRALQPGGVIQYTPSESVVGMLAGNKQLQLVVDTMRDFQYHSLEVSLEYSPEGDLLARTSLKGSNPNFENGREIHLNLNLEENLSTLLKSLRLSDDVSRNLIKKASRKASH